MEMLIMREMVRPVRVSKLCPCEMPGVSLVSNGMMAGHPPTYMYSCPRCKKAYYFKTPDVTVEYEPTGSYELTTEEIK